MQPPSPEEPSVVRASGPGNAAAAAAFFAAALLISCYDLAGSGSLFPDSPRYANGAAMMHDWLAAGDLAHPVRFASANYARYPGFSIPYHPPVYPALLGAFYFATGVSYAASRVFIGLCLGASGCAFFAILKRFGLAPVAAFGCTLVLMTTPEIVLWSRDTMSELPALMFILAGSYFFLGWCGSGRTWECLAAFGLAELAFLSRVTTCAVLPAWFVYATLTGRFRRLVTPPVIAASLLYLGLNAGYVKFAVQYSKFETSNNPTLGASRVLSWENVSFYPLLMPDIVGWGSLAAAAAGVVAAARLGRRCPAGLFWLSWLVCYYAFQVVIATNYQRYFLFGVPAVTGLIACLFDPSLPRPLRRNLAPLALGLAMTTNVTQSLQVPRGVVGYEAAARRLAGFTDPGNVMLASPQFQDLIFRFRCLDPKPPRLMLRSDRTFAIRLSPYTGVAPTIVAQSASDVEDVVRRGRVRYLVTASPDDPRRDDRVEEMVLVDNVVRSAPDRFEKVFEAPLLLEYGVRGRGPAYKVMIWRYLKDLPGGPSEIPVLVPTAGLEIR